MNNSVSFNALNKKISFEANQKKENSQENFTALDKEQLKQDTVEPAKKTAEDNFIVRTVKKVFGNKDVTKCIKSVLLTIISTIGVAYLGNKSLKFMTNAGLRLDSKLLKDGSLYKKIGDFFKGIKTQAATKLKDSKLFGKTFKDITETFKSNKAKPRFSFAKGQGRGFATQFAYTVGDVVHTSPFKANSKFFDKIKKAIGRDGAEKLLVEVTTDETSALEKLKNLFADEADDILASIKKNNETFKKSLKALVGDGVDIEKYFKKFIGSENIDDQREFAQELTELIAKKARLDKAQPDYYEKLANIFGKLKAGDFTDELADLSEEVDGVKLGDFFTNITMNREGFIGGWWPSNIIDKLGKKLGIIKKGKNFGKGNLGDALLKFNIADGKMARTKLGSLLQQSVLIPAESISNYNCDHAGMNLFLVPMIYNLFNTAQDAPKGQKVATVADDWVGSIGNIAIAMPASFAATYGLATLGNLKGDSLLTKYLLKPIGKFFSMGLGKTKNPIARAGGLFLRFAMMMAVFSPIISKPINKLIHKIFGKPYNPEEEAQKAQLEAQKNTKIPGLDITYGELEEKIQNNPQVFERLQTDPMLARQVNANPQLLLDLLDGKEITQKPKDALVSPLNKDLINKYSKTPSYQPMPQAQQAIAGNAQMLDTATYIPSSGYVAKSSISKEQIEEYNKLMAESDKLLESVNKFLG